MVTVIIIPQFFWQRYDIKTLYIISKKQTTKLRTGKILKNRTKFRQRRKGFSFEREKERGNVND